MKLWGGRFEGGSSELFERFSASLQFDRELLFADVTGSQAFARALAQQGILSDEECRQLVDALAEIASEARDPAYFDGALDEDVHTFVIRKLQDKVGALSGKMHTGRSRNEQVSLDLRIYLKEAVDTLVEHLTGLMRQLLELAGKYPQSIIPGYTHLRRAQPVLWPHYLLAYFEMFSRDCERLEQTRARIDVMPLGSGALAGSGFPFDREALRNDLNFAAITRNSMDAAADRDFALDFLYSCALIMLHLSRLSEDWILYSSDEFGWLHLADTVTSGSSLMPQKHNPDSLELIRGKCGRVFADLSALFIVMKGLPMTYNRDMQEDKEPLFDAFHETSRALAMAKMVAASLVLDSAKPLEAVEQSWVVATDLAEELARSGVPFERAHRIVGELVLASVKAGKHPSSWTSEALTAFAPEFTPEIAKLLSPAEGMKHRELPGGAGPTAVARALHDAHQRLEQFERPARKR